VSNELRGADEATADALLEAGVTLFTLGLSGPEYDIAQVKRWLTWRDAQR